MYVVVDWRPYDLPEVYGPFTFAANARSYATRVLGVDPETTDGVDVRTLHAPYPEGDSQYHGDYPLGA